MTLVDAFLTLRGYTIKCANILVLLAYLANVTTSASQKEILRRLSFIVQLIVREFTSILGLSTNCAVFQRDYCFIASSAMLSIRLELAEVLEVPLATPADFTCLAATDRLFLQFCHSVTKITEVRGWFHFFASSAFEGPQVRRAPGAYKIPTSYIPFAHVLAVLCLIANAADEYLE